MKQETLYSITKSWVTTGNELHSIKEILEWVTTRNATAAVDIHKSTLSESKFWFYDQQRGTIHNLNHSFFSIAGFEKELENGVVVRQQVILQQEIGLLGIICQEFNGVTHFSNAGEDRAGKHQQDPALPHHPSNKKQLHPKAWGSAPALSGVFRARRPI